MRESQRRQLIGILWDNYIKYINYYPRLFPSGAIQDHLAIIDIGCKNSSMKELRNICNHFGFEYRGEGYIPEKINDFSWFAEPGIEDLAPNDALPQVIIADFRVDLLSKKNRDIIYKYTAKLPDVELNFSNYLPEEQPLVAFKYLTSRPWALPTVAEYLSLKEEIPLIAWAFARGRRVNHFGVCVHLDGRFESLEEFNLELSRHATLNNSDGEIQGSPECGIEQSSAIGSPNLMRLSDGEIMLNNSFMEFVWRYKIHDDSGRWGDYYCNFIPRNATNIVESTILKERDVA